MCWENKLPTIRSSKKNSNKVDIGGSCTEFHWSIWNIQEMQLGCRSQYQVPEILGWAKDSVSETQA